MFRMNLFLVAVMTASYAQAASGAVPAQTVVYQLANLSLLLGFLYFTQRKTIAQAFANKRAEYLENVNAASRSKEEAEAKLAEVKQRVHKMQSTFSQQIADAEKNAEESYKSQLADAKNEAVRVKDSAQTSLEFEVQKQIEQLRVETFKKSANIAEERLKEGMTPEQLKTWNEKFSQQGVH